MFTEFMGKTVELTTKSGAHYTGMVSRTDDVTTTLCLTGEKTDFTVLNNRVESIETVLECPYCHKDSSKGLHTARSCDL